MKIKTIFSCLLLAVAVSTLNAQSANVGDAVGNKAQIEALTQQAVTLESKQQFESAISKYTEVLKLDPKDFRAMNSIAGLYGVLGKAEEESVWAQRAVDTNPQYWQGYVNLGNSRGMLGQFESAVKAYDKAVQIAPKEPIPIYSLGVIAENQGDLKRALVHYLKSIELDANFENGLFSAAAMHANLKQLAEAKALLKRLLKINPQADDAREMLAQLEKE